jgi:hypothetical protein
VNLFTPPQTQERDDSLSVIDINSCFQVLKQVVDERTDRAADLTLGAQLQRMIAGMVRRPLCHVKHITSITRLRTPVLVSRKHYYKTIRFVVFVRLP